MARIKRATMTHKRRKKVLKLAKGYYGAKSKLFKTAKQAVMKSGQYAYIGRKQKARLPQTVDHPHLRRLQGQRHELLHLYQRPEKGRHLPQPQNAVGDRHP